MGLESKVVEDVQKENIPLVDREKTCPLLLRVFCNLSGRHNSRSDFSRSMPGNELQIYTWLDATLKELTRLITEVYPNTKTKGTSFNFSLVWPNPRSPGFGMREIGATTIGSKGPDDNSTLQSKKFVIGDYLDVAISVPRSSAPYDRDRDRDRDSRRDTKDVRGSNDRRDRRYNDYR